MCFIRVNNIDYSTKVGGVNVGQEGGADNRAIMINYQCSILPILFTGRSPIINGRNMHTVIGLKQHVE